MDINIRNLVYQLTPPHKRLPVRLRWLTSLLAPLADLWDSFYAQRIASRMLVNVNSQTGVLEGYLRVKFNTGDIRVESYGDGLLWVPLSFEAENLQPDFALRAGEEPNPAIPLQNEIRSRFNGVDFIVYIPDSIDRVAVMAEIDKYKQALIKYELKQA